MPFTVSHVAAVLPAYRPLSRARLFSAAVIGSMAPDFGLLLPGFTYRWQTHSLMALWTFCLPMGMVGLYAMTLLLIKLAALDRGAARSRLRAAAGSQSLERRPVRPVASPRAWSYAVPWSSCWLPSRI